MALIVRLLGASAVSGAGTNALYTVPTTVTGGAVVKNVRLVNTGGGSANANLFYKPNGGNAVRIFDKDRVVSMNDVLVLKPDLTMAAGDKIELVTAAGASFEYVVSGIERS